MKYFVTVLLIATLCVFAPAQTPGNDHLNHPRKNTGKYQIELSHCCHTLTFSLLDADNNLVQGAIVGAYAELFYPDGSHFTVPLQQQGQLSIISGKVSYPGFQRIELHIWKGSEQLQARFESGEFSGLKSSN